MANEIPTLSYLERGVQYFAGFCETKADQSMTRAVTLLCAIGGLIVALAAYKVAIRPHLDDAAAKVIAALVPLATAFVAAGCVALAKRTKSTDAPSTETKP